MEQFDVLPDKTFKQIKASVKDRKLKRLINIQHKLSSPKKNDWVEKAMRIFPNDDIIMVEDERDCKATQEHCKAWIEQITSTLTFKHYPEGLRVKKEEK